MSKLLESKTVSLPVIRSRSDHRQALQRLNTLIEQDDPSFDFEIKVLGLMIDNFERKELPLPDANPVDAIKYRMKEIGLNASALAEKIGVGRSRVSEILNHRRRPTVYMIRDLAEVLGIPHRVLLQDYELKTPGRKFNVLQQG